MGNPTYKHRAIDDAHEDRCIKPPTGCGGLAVVFRDAESVREYSISGLCQKCQDDLFGDDEEAE